MVDEANLCSPPSFVIMKWYSGTSRWLERLVRPVEVCGCVQREKVSCRVPLNQTCYIRQSFYVHVFNLFCLTWIKLNARAHTSATAAAATDTECWILARNWTTHQFKLICKRDDMTRLWINQSSSSEMGFNQNRRSRSDDSIGCWLEESREPFLTRGGAPQRKRAALNSCVNIHTLDDVQHTAAAWWRERKQQQKKKEEEKESHLI